MYPCWIISDAYGKHHSMLDIGRGGVEVGCKSLLNRVRDIEPKYHIFRHIHESGGRVGRFFDHKTQFINACVVNLSYNMMNNGVVIEL